MLLQTESCRPKRLGFILRHWKNCAQIVRGRDEQWLTSHGEAVKQFEAAFEDFLLSLKIDSATEKRRESSRVSAFRTATTWSFIKFENYTLLDRFLSLLQYINTPFADD